MTDKGKIDAMGSVLSATPGQGAGGGASVPARDSAGGARPADTILVRPNAVPSAASVPVPSSTPAKLEPAGSEAGTVSSPSTLGTGSDLSLLLNAGDVILELYEIRELLGEGGMGRVYKANHLGWNLALAVKTPKPEIIDAVGSADAFAREAETWVNLDLHAHVVNCYYVRIVGGIPLIFVEYLPDGSLSDWIRSKKLYVGDPEEVLARIIDVAIQAAWGLHFAHTQGLIHQDVKPANVMMAVGGRVKVTDFGLARAKSRAGTVTVSAAAGQTLVVAGAGMFTPAYASPEQIAGQALTVKTDIWSWAATVVEMFAGGMFWPSGQFVGEFFDDFLKNWSSQEAAPRPPESLVSLLKECLKKDPEERPGSLQELASILIEDHPRICGRIYSRPVPIMGLSTGDSLNNRAVSLVDLGNQDRALTLWEDALKAQPYHPEVTYNRGLILWRSGKLDEVRLVTELEEVLGSAADNWLMHYLLGLIHMERGDYSSAVAALEKIPETDSLYQQAAALTARSREAVPRSRRLLWAERGHTEAVFSVYLSEDGRYALSGSEDATIKLWEVESGACLRTFAGHMHTVVSVAFTEDMSEVFSASRDGTLRLWNLDTGECVKTVRHSQLERINAASLSLDGRHVMVSTEQATGASLWDVREGVCLGTMGMESLTPSSDLRSLEGAGDRSWETMEDTPDAALCLFLTADHRYAVSGSRNSLTLWDVRTGRPIHIFEGHADLVTSVCLSDSGKYVLSGSADCSVKLWETTTGRCLRTLKGHTDTVNSVYLSPDQRFAISGSADCTIKLWDYISGRCVRTFMDVKSPVTAVFIGTNGDRAVTGARDGTVRVLSITSSVPHSMAPLMTSRIQTVEKALSARMAFDREIKFAVAAMEVGDSLAAARHIRRARSQRGYRRHPDALALWSILNLSLPKQEFSGGWKAHAMEGHGGTVNSVCISQDNRYAISGCADGMIGLWDLSSGKNSAMFQDDQRSPVTSVSLSPDGAYAASGSGDGTVKLWDVSRGELAREFVGHAGPVLSVSLSHDGRYILSGSLDRTLKLWRSSTGKCIRSLSHELHLAVSVHLSQDGLHGLTGSWDKTLKLWDIATGRCIRTFADDRHLPASVCMSYDGRYALSGGSGVDDNRIWLWDLTSGKSVRTFAGHSDLVHSVSMGCDGRYALSGSADGTLKLWNVATGACLRTFVSHFGRVFSASLSQDAMCAVSGGDDKLVKVWTLDWELGDHKPADWDESARRYLEVFLTQHLPYLETLPSHGFLGRLLAFALSRDRKPTWSEQDFSELLHTLACAGYGWLRPKGVKRELENMADKWQ